MASNTTSAQPLKINFKIIDWMRGLAALYVVFNHARGILFSSGDFYAQYVTPRAQWGIWERLNLLLLQHANLGREFVILFFILSGFSIAHSLQNNSGVGGFYARRGVRLYPPYVTGILWALIIFLLIRVFAAGVYYQAAEGRPPVKEVYDTFTFLPNLLGNFLYLPTDNMLTGQYWSLTYEVIFYLLIPFFIKRLRWYAIATLALYAIGWMLKGQHYYPMSVNQVIPQRFLFDLNIYFLAGIVLYRYKDRLVPQYPLNRWVSLLLLIAIFEIVVFAKTYPFKGQDNKWTGLLMIAFTYVLLMTGLKHQVRLRFLEGIGTISYTLYVTHMASLYLVSIVLYQKGYSFYTINMFWPWLVGVVIAVLMAYPLYFIGEYPTVRYLQRLRKRKSEKAVQVAIAP